jgi:hypothetical protein
MMLYLEFINTLPFHPGCIIDIIGPKSNAGPVLHIVILFQIHQRFQFEDIDDFHLFSDANKLFLRRCHSKPSCVYRSLVNQLLSIPINRRRILSYYLTASFLDPLAPSRCRAWLFLSQLDVDDAGSVVAGQLSTDHTAVEE